MRQSGCVVGGLIATVVAIVAVVMLGWWSGVIRITTAMPPPALTPEVPLPNRQPAGQPQQATHRPRWPSLGAQPAATSSLAVDTPALIVPVTGVARSALRDDWGEARDGGMRAHRGLDIPAPANTLVIAAGPGRIEKLFDSAKGGTTLYERSADGAWVYYYAHLAGYAPGIQAGQTVRAGDPIGYVGDTGDAGPGNYHLHFGLSRAAGVGWWQGDELDPYPVLAGKPARR